MPSTFDTQVQRLTKEILESMEQTKQQHAHDRTTCMSALTAIKGAMQPASTEQFTLPRLRF